VPQTSRPPFTKRCPVCGYRFEATTDACPIDEVVLGRERPGLDRLGPYRLVERLAVGGMGAVYKAVHEKVGRAVALKLLHRSLRAEGVSVSRFFHEARAVNTIRHPNVVEVHDISDEGEDLYMVLELLRGDDLRTILENEPTHRLPPERVVFMLEQVCGALQAAHARNIVHRDLKPENVFLITRNNRADFVKLLDFGVAKLERAEGRITREGIALGTPEYMAPEQARGAEVDGRTDLYAVGCIAYEMLTGRTVFDAGSPGEVMLKQVREPPVPPRRYNDAIPIALEAVVLRCLAKSPRGRPQTGLELAQELCTAVDVPFDSSGAFMSWRNWDTQSSVSGVMALPDLRGGANTPVGRAITSMFARRRPLVAGLGAALALAGIAAVAWLGLRGGAHGPMDLPAAAEAAVAAPATTPIAAARVAAASAAPVAPRLVKVLVQSSPLEAEIFDESGARLGATPQALMLPQGVVTKLRLVRPGYLPAVRDVRAGSGNRTVVVALEAERKHAVAATKNPRAHKGRRPGGQAGKNPGKEVAKKAGKGGVLDSTAHTLNPF
jgi:serine/threonine protein kinase